MQNIKNAIAEMEWDIEQIDRSVARSLGDIADSLKFAQELFNDNPGKEVDYSFEVKARQMAEIAGQQSSRNALIKSVAMLKKLLVSEAADV